MDTNLEEKALIERAKTDKEAFGLLYERYVDRIYNYIYYRTSNKHDAEDLTATVFIKAMQHIPRYQDQGFPFSAWLYRIARNLVANWQRDQSRRRLLALDDISQWHWGNETPEFSSQIREDRQALLNAIHHLPAERQELLIFKYVDKLSNAEIGAIMDRSEGAVKSLYHRTLLSLRELLQATVEKPIVVRQRSFLDRFYRRK